MRLSFCSFIVLLLLPFFPVHAEEEGGAGTDISAASADCNDAELSVLTEGGGNGFIFVDLRAEFSGENFGTECLWDFGDGWRDETCNPPSHTYENAASYNVVVEVMNQCGNTVIQTIAVEIGEEIQEEEQEESEGMEESENLGECGSVFSGISVSEFLPNPTGDEAKEEWIELRNDNAFPVTLCGWQLDDGEGGSKPYVIDGFVIPAQSFQILPRSVSGLALNNDRDSVRLYAPLAPGSSEKILIQTVNYEDAPDGSSYASADGGMTFAWTTAPTPNTPTIPPKPRVFLRNIVIASALPNPTGSDTGNEWIELYSLENEQIDLSGYAVTRGSQRGVFGSETVLSPRQLTRVNASVLGLTLPNTDGELALCDPAGIFITSLEWQSASDGVPARHVMPSGSRILARVSSILDGQTVELTLVNPPKELSMYGLLGAELLGIDAPSLTSTNADTVLDAKRARDFLRALIQGKEVELEFDTKTWSEEGKLLAYFSVDDGMSVQEEMLEYGIVEAREKDDYARHSSFISLQQEAENQHVGIWSSSSSSTESDDEDEESNEEEAGEESEEGEGEGSSQVAEPEKSSEEFFLYGRAEVLITEIYPHPKKGSEQEEWLEIRNHGEKDAHLGGFKIEDVTASKSRFFVFPQGFVIETGEFALLPKSMTKLALNNGGQELVLRDAEGAERQRISYPSVKEGYSYLLSGENWCLSAMPSPKAESSCSGLPVGTKASSESGKASSGTSYSKKPQQSGLSLLKTKFRNIIKGSPESSSGAVQESFSGVLAGMTTLDQSMALIDEEKGNGFPKRYLVIGVLALIGGILSLYGSRFPLRKEKY